MTWWAENFSHTLLPHSSMQAYPTAKWVAASFWPWVKTPSTASMTLLHSVPKYQSQLEELEFLYQILEPGTATLEAQMAHPTVLYLCSESTMILPGMLTKEEEKGKGLLPFILNHGMQISFSSWIWEKILVNNKIEQEIYFMDFGFQTYLWEEWFKINHGL